MNIEVNGEAVVVSARTLADLLAELGYENALVATALNADFVARSERDATPVSEGDRIEIIAPMKGG